MIAFHLLRLSITLRVSSRFGWVFVATASVIAPTYALATDPMRTALIVNEKSIDSLTIANHYAAMRAIPDRCIIVLGDVPPDMSCTIAEMRAWILKPLLLELDKRGLGQQTDLIAYSAGFPTAITLDADFAKVPPRHQIFTPVGSLNGLTSLYQLLADDKVNYVATRSNFYARADHSLLMQNPFADKDRDAFNAVIAAADKEDWNAASELLLPLIKKHPAQWPLRFRLAGYQMRANKQTDALESLASLLRDGVISAPMLQDDKSFDPLREDENFVKLVAAMPTVNLNRMPPVAFSARTPWGQNGLPIGDQAGPRYLLSVVLAVTRGRGTTVDEAIEILKRAAEADGTGESSAFYFSNSSDVRSSTRMPLMPVAAVALRELGHEVIIDKERLPHEQTKLMGVMLGSANYEWPLTGSKMLPGALADNLTSTSGVLHQDDGQTSMVELLRAGAAGTSGTVTEPYALQFKFPTPLMYAYYASGATLAEAYFLSVESPYQLLIVGDPLCRPFGDEHNELFEIAINQNRPDLFNVQVRFWRDFAVATAKLSRMEMYFAGRLVLLAKPASQFPITKTGLPLGWHQVTVVGVSRHPLEMRTWQSTYVLIGDEADCPTLQATINEGSDESTIQLTVDAHDAEQIAVEHLGRRIIEGTEKTQTIAIERVGYGPVRLTPLARRDDVWIPGKPITLNVPASP